MASLQKFRVFPSLFQNITLLSRRKMSDKTGVIDTPLIALDEAHRFIVDCMVAAGVSMKYSKMLADNLIEADYRGHHTLGMSQLEMYIRDVQNGVCDGNAVPCILKQTKATAWVRGNNGLGAVVGRMCMNLAVKKAKEVGIGIVVAKESNHFGIAAFYTIQAAKQGLIGLSFTNSSPLMVPTRAKGTVLGANPLSLAAPGSDKDNFVLDMATTIISMGKIEVKKAKEEPLPEGCALDSDGCPTTDADEAKKLLPLGGSEETAGYKGYGLSALVEIFCGILGDAAFGPNIQQWGDCDNKANLGQCFIAIDPNCFAPDFQKRLKDFMEILRNQESVDPEKPVLVAGDVEKGHMEFVDKAGGIRYAQENLDIYEVLSKCLQVDPLKPKCDDN